jgi:hypothetical protein
MHRTSTSEDARAFVLRRSRSRQIELLTGDATNDATAMPGMTIASILDREFGDGF